MYSPCFECFNRRGEAYTSECDETCTYAKRIIRKDIRIEELEKKLKEAKNINDIFEYIDKAFDRTPYEGSWITDTGERVSCDVGYAYEWWNDCMKPELIRVFGKE